MRVIALALLLLPCDFVPHMTVTLKPLGLVTQPNTYGQYPAGALHTADNVAMRDAGKLQSFPALRDYRASIASSNRVYKMFPHESSVLAFTQHTGTLAWTPRWVTSSAATTITMPSGFTITADTGKLRASTVAGRTIVTNSVHLLSFDGEAATTARRVGVPPPSRINSGGIATNAQAILDDTTVNYRAYIERSVTIGTSTIVLVGAVSGVSRRPNTSGVTIDGSVFVQWPSQTGVTAGDVVRLFRTKAVAIGSDPGDTMYLAATAKLTSTNISNGYVTVRDPTPDNSLTEELYTNPGQQTLTENNWVPPLADDVESFGGFTFYASRRLQNQIILKVPGGWGILTTDAQRANGVGSRAITGDTHSSTTVDNISASHILGLAVGQSITGSGIPASTTIAAVGASSVTLSASATATAAGVSLTVVDNFEIDGLVLPGSSWSTLQSQTATIRYLLYSDKPTFPSVNEEDLGATVLLTRYYGGASQMSIRATNGANFSPALPTLSETAYAVPWDEKPNRISWSKKNQPEAVPTLGHDALVGNGTVYRMIAVSDRMYLFCSDGLYQLTGSEGVWRIEMVDNTLVLAARDAADRIGDVVYAYTNKGLVSVSVTTGVLELSSGVIAAENPSDTFNTGSLSGAVYSDTWDVSVACDELHSEAWIRTAADTSAFFVWNAKNKAFTKFVDDGTIRSIAYSRALRSLMIGNGASASIQYFELDTSNVRKDEAIIVFQPFAFGNPTDTNEFIDIDWVFTGVGNAITAGTNFNRVYLGDVTIAASADDSHCIVNVPRNAPSVATTIQPGLEMSDGSEDTRWALVAVDVSYRKIGSRANR
jgi:hypothetical protein